MFNYSNEDRLTCWAQHRADLNTCNNPLEETWKFWKHAPFIAFNNKINPHYQASWPTPWEIIVENKYDDFTKALMIAKSLAFTPRFKQYSIDIKICLDTRKSRQYNIVFVEDMWAINYDDSGVILVKDLPQDLYIENIITVHTAT
jgi:hypothetical protein